MKTNAAPVRAAAVGPRDVVFAREAGGVIRMRSPHPLGDYPRCLTDRLAHWAKTRPERVCFAQRDAAGAWRSLSWAEVHERVQRVGQALLDRGLGTERPVVILSENSIEHALLGLAALHVGVLYAPISPAYSLVSTDLARLRHIVSVLRPGLVFAADGQTYARAIDAVVGKDVEIVVSGGAVPGRACTPFGELEQTGATEAVVAAHRRIEPDAPAKILFTSGSTSHPKGVINTHRLLTSNPQAQVQAFPLYGQDPLVMVDWLPWHHTAGGNADFGAVIYNGGTVYIDEGKPVEHAVEATVRNLRDVAPTVYVSMPRGFALLIPYLKAEKALREKFFSRLRMMFYAGAAMSQHLWDELEALSLDACGEIVPIMTGLGSTETGPFAFASNWRIADSRCIGLPASSVEVKLVPNGEKLEVRVRGPYITPGYWRDEALTRAAFDEENYYRMGDALKFVDPSRPEEGLLFDGRVSEDFKLTTGTWVSVGPLRAHLLLECAPYAQDVVVAGHDRDYIGVLIVPDLGACAGLAGVAAGRLPARDLLALPPVRERFRELLERMARASTGSSNRVMRALLLDELPSLDRGEMTDKGSLSQRSMLEHRADLIEELYSEPPSPRVIVLSDKTALPSPPVGGKRVG